MLHTPKSNLLAMKYFFHQINWEPRETKKAIKYNHNKDMLTKLQIANARCQIALS